MKYFAVLIALLLSGLLTAQPIDVLHVDMSNQQLDVLTSPLHIKKVVDVREQPNTPLGTGYEGPEVHPVLLLSGRSTEKELDELFGRSFQQRDLPGGILRLTYLRIDEYFVNMIERRRVDVEADYLLPKGDGFVRYGPVRVSASDNNVLRYQPYNAALTSILNELVVRISEEVETGRSTGVISKENIRESPSTYPLEKLRFHQLPDGVYQSLMHFRAGAVEEQPIKISYLYRAHTQKDGLVFMAGQLNFDESDDRRTLKDAWGVQYDGKAYLNFRGALHEIHKTADDTIRGLFPSAVYNQWGNSTAIRTPVIMFGSLSGGAAAEMMTPNWNALLPADLDLATGEIRYNSDLGKGERTDSVFLVSSDFNKEAEVVTVKLSDGKLYAMRSGEYLKVGNGDRVDINPGTEQETSVWLRKPIIQETAKFVVVVQRSGKVRIDEAREADAELFRKRVAKGKEVQSSIRDSLLD